MAIGKANSLLWHLPDDLKRFKQLTTGHPVVMGRRTWESIPEKFRPLSNRTSIIVTRDTAYSAPGATVVTSIDDAIDSAKASPGAEEIFIIGGAEIYKATLLIADRLYVTEVETEVEADAFFPEYKSIFTKKISTEHGEHEGLKYTYLILEK
jgi:dihydrofolate reductase